MDGERSDAVLLRRHGTVVVLVLNRPARLNAIDAELADSLQVGLDAVGDDPDCRCLVITGSGQGFCAGQALPGPEGSNPLPEDLEGLIRERYVPLVLKLWKLQVPVIAAVNGVATGAGFSLALAADIRVASDAAWFSCAFCKIGLVPDSGSSFFLPRLLGFSKGLELALTGDRLDAAEAQRMGLVAKVYPSASFAEDQLAFASKVANGATRALGLTKKVFRNHLVQELEEQMELEARLQQRASETSDFREGLRAFTEKRSPQFIGS